MNELDFSAYMVSRVCHDLVSPLGAVVNGLEVLEDERDAAMRADALKIVGQPQVGGDDTPAQAQPSQRGAHPTPAPSWRRLR